MVIKNTNRAGQDGEALIKKKSKADRSIIAALLKHGLKHIPPCTPLWQSRPKTKEEAQSDMV